MEQETNGTEVVVTEEVLQMNPELVDEVVVGDVITLPSEEEVAQELSQAPTTGVVHENVCTSCEG